MGGERGREGGGVDLNLGTPEAVFSDNAPPCGLLSVGEARRSEKEVVMKGCVEKVKLVKEFALAEVSKLPEEDAMRKDRRLGGEKIFETGRWKGLI